MIRIEGYRMVIFVTHLWLLLNPNIFLCLSNVLKVASSPLLFLLNLWILMNGISIGRVFIFRVNFINLILLLWLMFDDVTLLTLTYLLLMPIRLLFLLQLLLNIFLVHLLLNTHFLILLGLLLTYYLLFKI